MKRPAWPWLAWALLFVSATAVAQGADNAAEIRKTQEKMAELYEAKSDLKGALKVWRELLSENPRDRKVLDNVARLAYGVGEYQAALPVLEQLVRLSPESAIYRTRLAQTLQALKRDNEALPHLEWSLKKTPNDVTLRIAIAAIYEAMKKPKLALAQYDWLIAHKPSLPTSQLLTYRLTRVSLYADLKLEKAQIAELKAIERDYPKNLQVRRELATHYLDMEKFDDARRELKAILTLDKSDAKARAQLARIEKAEADALRKAAEQREAEERYQDWLLDMQQRAEDF